MKEVKQYNESIFESIKHIDEYGNEYWKARELMDLLEYTNWRNFEILIKKLRLPVKIVVMIKLAKGAIREIRL